MKSRKMKIIVGLGNPGKEYENTRHNIGFRVVDYLNKQYGGVFKFDQKSNSEPRALKKLSARQSTNEISALVSEVKADGQKILLVKPQTFVNESGKAVKKIVNSKQLTVNNLVVVHDDLDVPFGKVKSSFARGSAGHRGVESVIKALKTDKFHRIRFGTFGPKLARIRKIKDKRKRTKEMNDFVVGPFTPTEKQKLPKLIKTAVEKTIQLINL